MINQDRRIGNRIGTALGLAMALALPAMTGCATKGYVRERVEGLDAKLTAEDTLLRTDISETAARADVASRDALRARELALGDTDFREADRYTVNFAFDSAELDGEAESMLDQAAEAIRGERRYVVDLYGYTCTIGDSSYNDQLSRRRADAVLRYLLQRAQVPLGRFALVGLGESEPLVAAGAEDHPASRRVVVSLMEAVEPAQQPQVSHVHPESRTQEFP